MEEVILVDEENKVLGSLEKMEAHQKALLHRAFSVFVFNSKDECLLQRRAISKYHSAGLWTNTCCSHPKPGEDTRAAAMRRLKEEMGFETPLREIFQFTYKAGFDNGLTEHEFDHVFIGKYEGEIIPDPGEVVEHEYWPMEKIRVHLESNPDEFTVWFRIAFPKVLQWWHDKQA